MMLHEAVMLEIYRQALNASELASPRCQSRESHNSTLQSQEGRCPSNESQCSANDSNNTLNQMSLTPTTPPVALPLPATLAPAAAAALLPPQTAAMAAYLNAAAAAAAQQNHLLLTNPLAAAASLVHQATQQVSNVPLPHDNSRQTNSTTSSTVELAEAAALDFTTKTQHHHRSGENGNGSSEDDVDGDENEGNGDRNVDADGDANDIDDRNDHDDERDCFSNNDNDGDIDEANSPLDLSLNSGRHKRQLSDNDHYHDHEDEHEDSEDASLITPTTRKMLRCNDYKTLTLPASSTWMPPINPYLAAVAVANNIASPNKSTLNNQINHQQHQHLEWNHKGKIAPNEATKALEKMTEMTRIAASSNDMDLIKTRQHSAAVTTINSSSNSITITATIAATTTVAITTSTSGATTNGRHSAWQSHWLNKGADAVKDVFKCVWCKQSFATLASLTTHMKETQHCGVHVASSINNNGNSNSNNNGNSNSNSNNNSNFSNHQHHQLTQSNQSSHRHSIATQGNALNGNINNANSNTNSNSNGMGIGIGNGSVNNNGGNNNAMVSSMTSGNKSDLNILIKETMPLPRKLVRGQDVWLGKGAEQTRQILKCMWCGQSFRSLAEMTAHMQETQHYTNIISQEQIISWKSTDDKNPRDRDSNTLKTGRSTSSPSTAAPTITATPTAISSLTAVAANGGAGNNNALCAVLTCKVCEQSFPTLKELSNHMIKNNHYKEHMMRAGGGGGACGIQQINDPMPTMIRSGTGGGNGGAGSGRGRQTKEKRKKSLPVRKLLEMERAQQDYKISTSLDQALKPLRDFAASTKITCEKCNEKIETALFVDHIRQCIGGNIVISPRSNNHYHNNNNNSHTNNRNNSHNSNSNANNNSNNLQHRHTIKSNYRHNNVIMNEHVRSSPRTPTGRKNSENTRLPSPAVSHSEILCPLPADNEKPIEGSSVLNALEQLIEKSFDTRPRLGLGNVYDNSSTNTTPLGSSILKRLGIDDAMDYTKPLMDPQTMQFLRSYSNYPSSSSIRDRSASESSSISERGGGGGSSGRLDAFTPDMLKNDYSSRQTTPRLTPEKLIPPNQDRLDYVRIKSEPIDITERSIEEHNKEQDVEKDARDERVIINDLSHKISVKKEFTMAMDGDMMATPEKNNGKDYGHSHAHGHDHDLGQSHINDMDLRIIHTRNISPSLSDRSLTPKSTTSSLNERKEPSFQMPLTMISSTATTSIKSSISTRMSSTTATTTNEGGSLNALSSMFNNLNNNLNSNNLSAINSNALDSIINNNHCGRGSGGDGSGGGNGGSGNGNSTGSNGHKKANANPLAALQKLCETTDTPPAANTRSSTNSNSHNNNNNNHNHQQPQPQSQQQQQLSSSLLNTSNNSGGSSSSGVSSSSATGSFGNNSNMFAFGWSCNDAQHSSDSLIKCSFCDIPFNSKGAYRHHLSKIHFIKDIDADDINNISSSNMNGSNTLVSTKNHPGGADSGGNLKSPPNIKSSKTLLKSPNRNAVSAMDNKNKSPVAHRLESMTTTATKSTTPTSNSSNNSITPTINPYDESAQAKFLKYAELAKQLSSKNS